MGNIITENELIGIYRLKLSRITIAILGLIWLSSPLSAQQSGPLNLANEPLRPLPQKLSLNAGKIALGRDLFHAPGIAQVQSVDPDKPVGRRSEHREQRDEWVRLGDVEAFCGRTTSCKVLGIIDEVFGIAVGLVHVAPARPGAYPCLERSYESHWGPAPQCLGSRRRDIQNGR